MLLSGPHQRGVTLVELLIALAIGSLLALGVLGVFVSSNQSSEVEEALNRVQQSGRTAVELVNRDIRLAGYVGCNSLPDQSAGAIAAEVSVAANNVQLQRILAYSANGSTLSPSPAGQVANVVKATARAGTDVLVVDFSEYLGNDLFNVGTTLNSVDSSIELDGAGDGECSLATGDLVLFSNCDLAVVFRVSNASGCSGGSNTITLSSSDNTAPTAGVSFRVGTEVAEFLQFIWYVADTGRDRNGQDVYALYRLASNQPLSAAEEMVEGVEFMRVEVGQRVGNNLRYAPPSAAGIDWDAVEAVKIAFLVQSYSPVADQADTATYQLLSTTVPATGSVKHSGGNVIRRVFTNTQSIRNTDYGQIQ